MASASALIFFTLSPEAEGRRKLLGFPRPEQAARVFSALRDHAMTVCSRLDGVDLLVAAPDPAYPPWSSASAGSTGSTESTESGRIAGYIRQRGRSFGESLRFAIEDAFSMGYTRAVVIGNDSPEISSAYLQDAFRNLDASEGRSAVLGPAKDGGYALLGLTAACPEIFEAMPWGSSRVARLTEDRLAAHGFVVKKLGSLADIDDPRGLARFLKRATKSLQSLARRVGALLAPVSAARPPTPPQRQEIFLGGWLTLRAPPLDFA